jgi:CRP-like cAMP-binding protein
MEKLVWYAIAPTGAIVLRDYSSSLKQRKIRGQMTDQAIFREEKLWNSSTLAEPVRATISQAKVRNRLLSLMPDDVFGMIAGELELIELPRSFVFSDPAQPSNFAYFIDSGIGSIVAITPQGQRSEVGIFGREGMTPASLVLDTAMTPYSIFMQVPGHGYRIDNDALRAAIEKSETLRKLLSRYAYALSIQTAYTGLSNSVHHIDERLARWILMCHDRTPGDQIALTHEFLSVMLAVRRSSVTTALHVLEGNHLVYSERNLITIRDRRALELFAGDAYGVPELEYQRLIGPMQ